MMFYDTRPTRPIRTRDQQPDDAGDLTEINQRLDRIEQAILILSQEEDGDDDGSGDDQLTMPGGTSLRRYSRRYAQRDATDPYATEMPVEAGTGGYVVTREGGRNSVYEMPRNANVRDPDRESTRGVSGRTYGTGNFTGDRATAAAHAQLRAINAMHKQHYHITR